MGKTHNASMLKGGMCEMKGTQKALSTLLALAMTAGLAIPAGAAEEGAAVTPYAIPEDVAGKLVILHTNDTHGADMAVEGECIGTAGVAQLKKDFEAAGANVLLVSAGDTIMGKPLVSANQGQSAFEFMNAAGYDAMTVGNHELDFGIDNLEKLAESADFDILCADMTEESTGNTVFESNKIYTLGGLEVGVFGLATPETRTKADASKMPGIVFPEGEELYACAQEQVDELKQAGADLIVCLGHLGIADESVGNRSIDVCENVDGIDLFIDGHSHSTTEEISAAADGSNVVNDTLIVSTGTALANVGVVIYDQDTDTLSNELVSAAAYTKVDPDVAELINTRNAEVEEEYGQVIATTEVDLNGSRSGGASTATNTGAEVVFPDGVGVRTAETNLGDFAADAILWQARQTLGEENVDAALTNGGGIRETLAVGDISMLDLLAVFPFGNTVATIDVTGAQLLEALEAATCTTPDAIGAFPQVAGIEFTVNVGVPYVNGDQYAGSTYYAPAEPGSRVTITTVNGAAFDPDATYTIATNDFTAKGGDTYGIFKTVGGWMDVGVTLDEALINYTTEALDGTISAEQYAEPAGRITIVNEPAAAFPTDVAENAWYYAAVSYVLDNGIMNGTSATTFAPDTTVTRGMVYQTLYNLAGQPGAAESTSFTDIEGKWYAAAASWAEAEGLTSGVSAGVFGGERTMTRQELAKVFADYAVMQGVAVPEADLSAYTDVDQVASWAAEGVENAVALGIISGSNNRLNPTGTAQRAELAQILMNFDALEPAYTVEHITVQNGERTVPAVVTMPVGEGPFPAVVMNHGHGGSKEEGGGFDGVAEALALKGVATIRMDFPGCGESTEPFTENYLSNMISDSNACKDYLVANYDVDAERLGILGYSMGGRIAATITGEDDQPYQAMVLLAGAVGDGETLAANLAGCSVEELDSVIAQAESDGKYTITTQYGQVQDLSAAWFREMIDSEPLANASNFTGPVLVIYGDQDTVVPADVNQLSLDAYENASEVVVPGADHGYGFYSDQPDVTALVEGSIADFFAESLAPDSEDAAA